MNKKWMLGAFISAIALSLVYVLILKPDDEGRIRARLSEISAAVRIDEPEAAPGPRAERIQTAFSDVFSRDVTVDVDDLAGLDRDGLLGLAISAGDGLKRLDLDFGNAAVSIDRAKRSAMVSAHLTVSAGALDGQTRREEQDLRLRFDNVDGDWKITRISHTPAG